MIHISKIEGERSIWGGKIYGVAQLHKLGLLIPESYALNMEQYTENSVFTALKSALLSNSHESYPSICKDIHDIIDTVQIDVPDKLAEKLRDAFPFVVRSSAINEDGIERSLAGCYQTLFGATTRDHLVRNIKECWKSAYAPELLQAFGHGNHGEYHMAILIQQQISCDKAGVYFSVDPLDSSQTNIVVEANWGNCITIVAGMVDPDRYCVDRVTMHESVYIGAKETYAEFTRGGVRLINTPRDIAEMPCLSTVELRKILKMAAHVEPIFGGRVDIEWGFMNEQCYILQCRPITCI